MATGFGCMVVGPAGSGKVINHYFWISIVNFLLSNVRSRRDS